MDMGSAGNGACGNGGWTLIMKIDGRQVQLGEVASLKLTEINFGVMLIFLSEAFKSILGGPDVWWKLFNAQQTFE